MIIQGHFHLFTHAISKGLGGGLSGTRMAQSNSWFVE